MAFLLNCNKRFVEKFTVKDCSNASFLSEFIQSNSLRVFNFFYGAVRKGKSFLGAQLEKGKSFLGAQSEKEIAQKHSQERNANDP